MPKISVIVPVYNVEHYLRQCVDSILNQTFMDFELLLVDDGSTDRSGAICDEYASLDARVKVFHTINRGVSAARNLGIDKASAEWITFVDSDDWVEEKYLSVFLYDNLRECCIVYQGILFDFDNPKRDNFTVISYRETYIQDLSKQILDFYFILDDGYVFGKLYNRKLLVDSGCRFDENLSIHEDVLFLFTYLAYIKEIRLSSPLMYHYMRRGVISLSSKLYPSEEYLYLSQKMQQCISSLCTIWQIDDDLYLKFIYTKYCLYKYILACINVHKANYFHVFEVVRSRRNLFDKYFMPINLKHKILWWLFFHRCLSSKCFFILFYMKRLFRV